MMINHLHVLIIIYFLKQNDGTVSTSNASNQMQQPTPNNDQQPAEQAPPQQNMWSFLKSLAFRLLVIYFISTLFRKGTAPQTPPPENFPQTVSRNLFSNGTSMDFFVYITENEFSPNFSDINELIWSQKNLIYGDWYGGPNHDSTYDFKTNIPISEV